MAKKEDLLSIYDNEKIKESKLFFIGLKPKKDYSSLIVKKIITITFDKFKKEVKEFLKKDKFSFFDFCAENNDIKQKINEIKEKYYLNQPYEKDFIKNISLRYLKENFKEYQILLKEYLDLSLTYEEIHLLEKVYLYYIINNLIKYSYKPYMFGFLKKIIKKNNLQNNYFNIKEEEKEIILRNNLYTRKLERYFLYIDDFLPEIKKTFIINQIKKDFDEYKNFIKEKYNKEISSQTISFLEKFLESCKKG